MKLLSTFFISLLAFASLLAQERQFVGMHGLQDNNGDLFFEYQGYNISVEAVEGSLNNDKAIQKIIKDNNLGVVLATYQENSFGRNNIIVESESVSHNKPNTVINNACYIFERENKGLDIILFQTLNQRNHLLEHEIVNTYFIGGLSEYVHQGAEAEIIDFVGREIRLGNLCNWISPNNISCKGGEISWSEFPSYQEAIVDLQARVLANESPEIKILSDEDVSMLFEGVFTIARRIVYMDSHNKYPLAVYYIAQEIRGRYVSCILSNYVYNRDDHELSLLLQQIMQYHSLPQNAMSEFDRPSLEEPHSFKNYWSRYNIYGGSVRLSAWMPIGNASHLYNMAPAISLTLGAPIKRDMAIDLTVSVAFATGRKVFYYYIDDEYILDAKVNVLASAGVRYRYQKEMARNVYFTPYIGVGYHVMQTNQLKYEAQNDEEEDKYYDMGTIDLSGGVDIRFKRFGAFLEYHYIPYYLSKHAKRNIGNSALNIGVYFVLW